jgi:hypothetical protein
MSFCVRVLSFITPLHCITKTEEPSIFEAKKLSYSKKFPGVAQEQYYLNQLKKRIDKTEHLKTFRKFINFCDNIRQNFR